MCPTAATLRTPAHQPPPPGVERQPPGEPCCADGLRVSEETYWREYYLESDIHYEWNNGRLEEKPMSDYGTFLVYGWFVELLQHFLDTRPIARMVALEMGFRPSSRTTVSSARGSCRAAIPVTDLLTQLEPKAMVRDPVYADFVLPEWREAEQRAEEQTRALQEAERELAQLRAQLAARGLKP